MRIGILGSSGFLGAELMKIFSARSDVEIVYTATSQKTTGAIADAQIVFLALRPEQSIELAPKLIEAGIKVIDLSGGYRLEDTSDYPKWYDLNHLNVGLLQEAVYGLPERNREKIRNAKLIANPGCYATAISLGLLPLIKGGQISSSVGILTVAVSGYTGAGKGTKLPPAITAYKSGRRHQHIPEIEQELGLRGQLFFYPHIAPWPRGIVVLIRVEVAFAVNILNLFGEFYKKEFFVRIKPEDEKVAIENVIGTNFCDICPRIKGTFAIIKVAIDNLGKGGAGQAVQNLNIMCGFPEELVY